MDNIDSIPEEIVFTIMKGKVGTEIAAQFFQFTKNYDDVIKVEDIENVFYENFENDSLEEVSQKIKTLMEKTETIHKSELAQQLAKKYMPEEDIVVFLAYLYSLDVEVCVAFLKGYRKDEPEMYKKLAAVDTALNDKKLFKRIVQASDKT
jgi:adenylate kinase family enzyme